MDTKKFYIATGKLVYAIAKADGIIQNKESRKFNNIIEDEVQLLSKAIGHHQTDVHADTALEFELMKSKNASAEEAFNSFMDFYHAHKPAINNDMKTEIVSFVTRIAKSSSGVSEKESKMINQLKDEFKDLKNS
ncbi:MAG: TerB family tellurite resistance protein [Sphingobacteriaceae bacterium]|nr:TerB family tellurite resistance protein [Sphingobacteriaceae bacterium]